MTQIWVTVALGVAGLVAGFLLCAVLSMGRLDEIESELQRRQGGER